MPSRLQRQVKFKRRTATLDSALRAAETWLSRKQSYSIAAARLNSRSELRSTTWLGILRGTTPSKVHESIEKMAGTPEATAANSTARKDPRGVISSREATKRAITRALRRRRADPTANSEIPRDYRTRLTALERSLKCAVARERAREREREREHARIRR